MSGMAEATRFQLGISGEPRGFSRNSFPALPMARLKDSARVSSVWRSYARPLMADRSLNCRIASWAQRR